MIFFFPFMTLCGASTLIGLYIETMNSEDFKGNNNSGQGLTVLTTIRFSAPRVVCVLPAGLPLFAA